MAELSHASDMESLMNLDWAPQQRADFEAALPLAKTEANVAVTGVTGSGKSTLINALCGTIPRETLELDERKETVLDSVLPAIEGDTLQPETQEIKGYVAQTASFSGKSFSIRVWDSPGVQDGSNMGNTYMQQLNAECGDNIDMLLYCVDMSVTRCVVEELVPGMTTVTCAMGTDVWCHAMVVLTFANIVEENIDEVVLVENSGEDKRHIFLTRLDHWQKGVRLALVQTGVPDEIVEKIPIEPAGNYTNPYLPDRIHWLGYLWLQFFTYARDDAKLAILITNHHRIKDASLLTPTDLQQLEQCTSPIQIPLIIENEHLLGITAISMGAASVAGACAGGVAGGLVAGSLTVGLGTGIGLVAGAAAGAVIGPLIGMAVNKMLERRKEKKEH